MATDIMGAASNNNHVIILVHGIRDFALWQANVTPVLEDHGFKVESTNYGRFNLLEFLIPSAYFRRKAIKTIERQVRIVTSNNPNCKISIIAHSFGTFVVANLIKQHFEVRIHRVIFCGSVVKYDFPFENLHGRFAHPIVNEVGTQDVWPAIAESITFGYGSAGTYGFRRPLVKDRWHNGAGHGFFLNGDFCKQYWIPLLAYDTIVPGSTAPEPPTRWIQFLSVVKIKYIILACLFILTLTNVPSFVKFAERYRSSEIMNSLAIPDPLYIGSVDDLKASLSSLKDKKAIFSRDQSREISVALTSKLISSRSEIDRVTRRYMNEAIVDTIIHLSDRDLSIVWRNLPKGLDLSYLTINGVNLRGVKFNDAFLIYTNFAGSKLDDAIFENCWMRNVDFSSADSLGNVVFLSTDWFHSFGLNVEPNTGLPNKLSKWTQCPEDYKNENQKPFKEIIVARYNISFDQIKIDDKEELQEQWRVYAQSDGLCDKILSNK